MKKLTKVAVWGVFGLTTLAFVLAGAMKLAGVPMLHESFAAMGLPTWFGYFIGAAELVGGMAIWWRKLAAWAGLGLAIIILGAGYYHIAYAVPGVMPSVVLGLFSILIFMVRKKDALFLSKQVKPI